MGIQINGQTDTVTATDGSINVGGDVTIPGVLTYDDVTNIDSIGIITARSDVNIENTAPTLNLIDTGGSTTASLLGNSGNIFYDTSSINRDHIFRGSTTEVVRITGDGKVGIGTIVPETNLTIAKNATNQTVASIPTVRLTNLDTTAVATDIVGSYEFFSKDVHSLNKVTGFMRNIPSDAGVNYDLTFGTIKTSDANAVERLRIDSSGRLLVGCTATPSNKNTVTPTAVIDGSGVNGALQINRHSSPGGGGSQLLLSGTRGSSVTSYTIVQSGDGLGTIDFMGADGDEFVTAARIQGQVDGTPGDNDMPGRLIFSTTPNGASTPIERLRIHSTGAVTKPWNPSANWSIQIPNTANHVRTFTEKRDAAGNLSAENAGNGSHGSVGRFTAPVAGIYLFTIRGTTTTTTSANNELLSVYGSWSVSNVMQPNAEVIDTRSAVIGNDGFGMAFTLYMNPTDHWALDWYRPTTSYTNNPAIWDISAVLLG